MSVHKRLPAFIQLFFTLNACFLFLQLLYIYTREGNFISSVHLPWRTHLEFFATLCVHLGLYLLLSLAQSLLLIGVLKRSWRSVSLSQWQIIIWSLCTCVILSANAHYFPLSIFSKILTPAFPQSLLFFLLIISSSLLGFLVINSLLYKRILQFLLLSVPMICILSMLMQPPKPENFLASEAEPNVIILGIDSLSPENITKENTPFLYQQLKTSTQFTNTVSPLARTYPAWSSILTGLYPLHHHADENLVPRSTVKSNASIVWQLRQIGYSTFFASDDRRFNSIDKDFGFQKIVGPKLGVNDVLLGTYNDLPLGNLVINCPVAAWLFPYNFINRASFFSYYPETFNNRLKQALSNKKTLDVPLFLAIHLTLPHWPYAWAQSSPDEVNDEFDIEKRGALYQHALQKVDEQFQILYAYLQKHQYFNNSLLIILSDHGEGLYYRNSRLTNYKNYQGKPPSAIAQYFKRKTDTVLNKSAGHGSDLLSPKQYHSMLGFKIFKNNKLQTKATQIKTRVALIDIAPTIQDFLDIPSDGKIDGISLYESLIEPKQLPEQRSIFIESGMFPNKIISKKRAMDLGKKAYVINPKTREIEIKANSLKYFNNQKLYGVLSGQWVLVLYPDDKAYIPVIQNLKSGKWSDDLNSDFAKATPALELSRQLQQFYGKKLAFPPMNPG